MNVLDFRIEKWWWQGKGSQNSKTSICACFGGSGGSRQDPENKQLCFPSVSEFQKQPEQAHYWDWKADRG